SNGLPTLAMVDSGSDLGFASALSVSSTFIDWGQGVAGGVASRGVEIAGGTTSQLSTSGTYAHAIVIPHHSNPDRVYVLAINTATTGLHPDGIGIYRTVNATIPVPTFTFVAQVDTDAGEEDNVVAAMDSTGKLHIVWEHPGAAAADFVAYRVYDDGTGNFLGAPVDISTGPGQFDLASDIDQPWITVNPANNDLLVTWRHDPAGSPTVAVSYPAMVKQTAGVWGAPVRISDPCSETTSNNQDGANAAFDSAGRIHVVWMDERVQDTIALPYVTKFAADGTTRLSADVQAFPQGPTASDDFTEVRIAYDATANRMVMVAGTSFSSAVNSAQGMHWYRTYTP
ncbi:MAG TPA: hypothetical protein VEI97_09925, partial [bacterium]|nr:hypothetical protein [bacterium]